MVALSQNPADLFINAFRSFKNLFCNYFPGTLTVEEVYRDRDQFAALVREVAAPDVGRMGIEILSFTIKDVYDNVQYLASLGKAQTAMVKRDADAGVAEANRDAGIRVNPQSFFTLICYDHCARFRKRNAKRPLWMLNIPQTPKSRITAGCLNCRKPTSIKKLTLP